VGAACCRHGSLHESTARSPSHRCSAVQCSAQGYITPHLRRYLTAPAARPGPLPVFGTYSVKQRHTATHSVLHIQCDGYSATATVIRLQCNIYSATVLHATVIMRRGHGAVLCSVACSAEQCAVQCSAVQWASAVFGVSSPERGRGLRTAAARRGHILLRTSVSH
jgi:hypothetical protein